MSEAFDLQAPLTWDEKSAALAAEMLDKRMRNRIRRFYCPRGRSCDGQPHDMFDYPHARVRLHPFLCQYVSGELQLLAVADARWIDPVDAVRFRFPEANVELVHAVAAGFDALNRQFGEGKDARTPPLP